MMKFFAFLTAFYAAGVSANAIQALFESDTPSKVKNFDSIKFGGEKFSERCRDVLNGEGPTFTIDVSDHTLAEGVGENQRLSLL